MLFAALDVATGQVTAGHYKRRLRAEFLDFMNRIVAGYPDKEIHIILGNLSTHKPKCDRWLARHPYVRFHFTPIYSSWLNQISIWFSILQSGSLAGASFTNVQQLRTTSMPSSPDITHAVPFVRTKPAVYQKHLKPPLSDW